MWTSQYLFYPEQNRDKESRQREMGGEEGAAQDGVGEDDWVVNGRYFIVLMLRIKMFIIIIVLLPFAKN